MKWLKNLLLFLLCLLLIAFIWISFNVYDRHAGYELNVDIPAGQAGVLHVGFSAVSITPEVPDTWTDANGDAQYREEDGDRYQDRNGNGRFDAVWMAGFQNKRPAMGIHDPLWARAMVIDDGHTRLGLLALDVIGFGGDDVIDLRKKIAKELLLDYVIVTSTHTHEGPDLLGLWGDHEYRSGIDRDYMKWVKTQGVKAINIATQSIRPARLRFAQDLVSAAYLVADTREPQVLDPGLRLLQAIDLENGTTLGTLVAWANHPETLWDANLMLSSDFPHYLREALEKGIYQGDSLLQAGLGGIAVYINGAIGGLMTTHPKMGVQDFSRDTIYKAPSFDKARAQGDRLAAICMNTLADTNKREDIVRGSIDLQARSVHLPMDNPLFRLAAVVGVLDRGFSGWMQVRSELSYWTLGPASFLHLPGEVYPEIINGGITKPEGQDFDLSPMEVPPLRSRMAGKYQFVVGLSNDMLGYIIPKSEWDEQPPFLYGAEESPYGEVNSIGPDTGPLLHQEAIEMMKARE